MPLHLTLAGRSDIGLVRRRNEDALALDASRGVAVVADGMGGHPGGDVASTIAAARARELLAEAADGEEHRALPPELLAAVVLGAHAAVRLRAREEPALSGMGTTLTALAVDPGRASWSVAHVGDSRAYLLRGGRLRLLTRDHTWAQERVESGLLSADEARDHPYAHILTQCIGQEEAPQPQSLGGAVEPGDTFLLCTDGLGKMLDDAEVADVLLRHRLVPGGVEAEPAVHELISLARARGGRDNVTVALLTAT